MVSKLFNIVQPDVAVFGQKDYQQLAIIKQLVRDLSYPIDIIAAPIVRASDGLALSSRNQYLSPEERQIAPVLQQELQRLAQQLAAGVHNQQGLEALILEASKHITAAGFVIDYLEIKTAQLEPVLNKNATESVTKSQELIIVVAAWLGRARLLDNLLVTVH